LKVLVAIAGEAIIAKQVNRIAKRFMQDLRVSFGVPNGSARPESGHEVGIGDYSIR
jgi:hypothetical protein